MKDDDKPQPLLKLSELVDIDREQRTKHQLRILDGLMAAAIREKDFKGALQIFNEARQLLARAK